jgi:DNA uptake protein ComE-like DNA-binding protein
MKAAPETASETAPTAPLTRLGVMMFLEFFVWGAWAVPMGKYLATVFSEGRTKPAVDMIIGQAYGTSSIAAIIAPLFVGLVADRFLPGQIVLGVLHLVGAGLLYGVARATRGGESGSDYRERLADLQLQAAKRGLGIWAHTDWDKLPIERRLEREEDRELRSAIDGAAPPPEGFMLDPNTASRDDLMRLPGVGETLANRIIEHRPYQRVVDLREVEGIGPTRFRELKPMLRIE